MAFNVMAFIIINRMTWHVTLFGFMTCYIYYVMLCYVVLYYEMLCYVYISLSRIWLEMAYFHRFLTITETIYEMKLEIYAIIHSLSTKKG